MSENLNAIIPTRPSSLYEAFGIDLVKPAEMDTDGTCSRDMEPVQWIELGTDFPEAFIVEAAQAAALDHGIVLGTTMLEATGDYLVLDVLSGGYFVNI